MENFVWADTFFIRRPLLPYSAVLRTSSAIPVSNPLFCEAVWLASPLVHGEMQKEYAKQDGKPSGKKIDYTLVKYHNRMATRCTPFGLFSGFNTGNWATAENAVIRFTGEIERNVRPDMQFVCALADAIAADPVVRPGLLLYPNNSVYTIGDETRYVEYKLLNGRRAYQISSVHTDDYVQYILQQSKTGIPMQTLAEKLAETFDVSLQDAIDYAGELVDAGLLVTEIHPSVTGEAYINRLYKFLLKNKDLARAEIAATCTEALRQLSQCITDIKTGLFPGPEKYMDGAAIAKQTQVTIDAGRLFQADTFLPVTEAQLPVSLTDRLSKVLGVLTKLTGYQPNKSLQSFAKRFHERYEERAMPLAEVLDTETGIPYIEKASSGYLPLVENIIPDSKKETSGSLQWGLSETFLNNKLNEAYKTGAYTITITDDELSEKMTSADALVFPPSMSVVFRLVEQNGNRKLFFEYASGSSAANLLGRFAYAHTDIENMIRAITRYEQAKNPEVIFAEVAHLPESRIGNVLIRPQLRNYEIPYLSQSLVEEEKRIDLSDLYIKVRNGQVILFSQKLGKQIIPRLATAHNYSYNSLPVYKFLCDLQTQGLQNYLSFDWGSLSVRSQFMPRVEYDGVVLSAATWKFTTKDYAHILGRSGPEAIQLFREKWKLPERVVLSEGDNELFIDFDDELHCSILWDAVKGKPGMVLREFLEPAHDMVQNKDGESYCNQFVAAILNTSTVYHPHTLPKNATKPLPLTRQFAPGTEWVYVKIYCGEKSADKILTTGVAPAIEAMREKHLLKHFFFLRYYDPGFHIRLRVKLIDSAYLGDALQILYAQIQGFVSAGYIWKVQIDTYMREVERYGENSMELSEELFCHDSKAAIDLISRLKDDENEITRWLYACHGIHDLLENFQYPLADRKRILEILKINFMAEFGGGQRLKIQLSDKYRENKQLLEESFLGRFSQRDILIADVLRKRKEEAGRIYEDIITAASENVSVKLDDLVSSYIHMMVNRVVLESPRLHELVIYTMLFQYYNSQLARQKINNTTEKAYVS